MPLEPISILNLPRDVVQGLAKAGVEHVDDLERCSPIELVRRSKLKPRQIQQVFDTYRAFKGVVEQRLQTAIDVMSDISSFPGILTICQEVDKLLGGGFQRGCVTELLGLPQTGKSQMILQAGLMAVFPRRQSQELSRSLLIDTEGGISAMAQSGRAAAMIQVLVDRLSRQFPSLRLDVSSVLKHVCIVRCLDLAEFVSIVLQLPELCERDNIVFVGIDSFTFHYRYGFSDNMGRRTRHIMEMAQRLSAAAVTPSRPAIVLANHLTSRHFDGRSHLTPSLGRSWASFPGQRLLLDFMAADTRAAMHDEYVSQVVTKCDPQVGPGTVEPSPRVAYLIGSNRSAFFVINECGIRDLARRRTDQSRIYL